VHEFLAGVWPAVEVLPPLRVCVDRCVLPGFCAASQQFLDVVDRFWSQECVRADITYFCWNVLEYEHLSFMPDRMYDQETLGPLKVRNSG
jgi:hypothetical protein